jgi:hypothetical protein
MQKKKATAKGKQMQKNNLARNVKGPSGNI